MNTETTTAEPSNTESTKALDVLCAEGTTENSPALECRGEVANAISPEGTAEPTPSPSTSATAPKPKSQHRPHRSKITNLPEPIRDFLNESIHNHVPYDKIIQSLAEKGHPGILPQNITAWTKTGYKLWLQERERFQCLRLKGEDVAKQFRQLDTIGKHYADRLNSRLIDLHMAQAIRDFDPNALKDLLQKDPVEFFKLFVRASHIQSLVRQRDDRLDVIRHKAGIGRKTGPNELARQSVKDAFNLSDSWFNPPETQQQHSA